MAEMQNDQGLMRRHEAVRYLGGRSGSLKSPSSRSTSGVGYAALLLGFAWIILPCLVGCQATTPAPAQRAAAAAVPLPTDRPATADEAVGSDECSIRLHDIEGALLMYYALNRRLPLVLDEIKRFADAGSELKLDCPVSKQPYVYSSAGLFAAGYNKRIIVWDATPAHHGSRWCIVMPHLEPGVSLVPEVIQVPEKAFAAFVPAIQ